MTIVKVLSKFLMLKRAKLIWLLGQLLVRMSWSTHRILIFVKNTPSEEFNQSI